MNVDIHACHTFNVATGLKNKKSLKGDPVSLVFKF